MNVLRKLQRDRLFLFRLLPLLNEVVGGRFDFTAELAQLLSSLIHRTQKRFKHFLQVEKLVLEVINLLVFGFETGLHFLRAVSKHVLTLAEIFDFELVLVKIGRALLQLLNHFLILLLEKLNLLSFFV